MTCKKIRYRDKIAAMMALASTSKARSSKRDEGRFYCCPDCKGWHLTSKAKSWKNEFPIQKEDK